MERSTLLTLAAVLSFAGTLPAQPVSVRDGAGHTVTLKAPARRVAALMSSAVDIMITLGAADRVAARTRYDTSNTVAAAANVGGGIDPSVEVLLASRPDLLIAWKGSATSAAVNRMRAVGVPVYLVETRDTAAMFATVRDIGAMLGLEARASAAAGALRAEFRAVQRGSAQRPRPTAVYLISRSPVIVAASTSYIAELVSVAGADNPFRDVGGDFPTLSLEAFIARDPDVLIVGRRPGGQAQLSTLRATAGWRDLRAVRNGAVVEVDGEQWGRPTLHAGALVRELAAALQRVGTAATRRP
ncbi:MAG: ABC transporter substrate-binding protein [Gemmatimonadaceae bacterium]|nr:ABC transporter substrate-binding protein [Gemmatimonadaceae bacterium]